MSAWAKIKNNSKQKFLDSGFKNNDKESWKYSNIVKIKDDFNQNPKEISQYNLEQLFDNKIDIVNGKINSESKFIKIYDLNNLNEKDAEFLDDNYKDYSPIEDVNNANIENIIFIEIHPGQSLELELNYINSGSINTQLWVKSYKDSNLKLIERFNGNGIHNHVSKFEVNGVVSHYKIHNHENYSFYNSDVIIKDRAEYSSFALSINCGFNRNEIKTKIFNNAICNQIGVVLGNDSQHYDNYLPIYHLGNNSKTNQNYKQLLNGKSSGVFYGKIIIPEGKIDNEAHQLNKNLSLSKDVKIYSRPELDIHNDQVVCSHGSTIGSIDSEAVYYLMSRGLDEKQAKEIVVKAFINEIMEEVEIKDYLVSLTGGYL